MTEFFRLWPPRMSCGEPQSSSAPFSVAWTPELGSTRLLIVVTVSGISIAMLCGWQRWTMSSLPVFPDATSKIRFDYSTWAKASSTVWITQIARVSFRTIDVLVIAMVLSVNEAGEYFLISRTAELQGFIHASLNLIVGPTIAKYHYNEEGEKLSYYLGIVSSMLFGISLVVFLICILGGQIFLDYLGKGRPEAYYSLVMLAFGQLTCSSVGSVGVVLNMVGREKINAKVLITTCIMTVICILVATPMFGMLGTAFASMFGICLWNVRLYLAVRKVTKLDPSVLGGFRLLVNKPRVARDP